MNDQTILGLCAQKPNEFLYFLIDALQPVEQGSTLHIAQLAQHETIAVPRADLGHSPHLCPQLVILAKPGAEPHLDLLNAALETVYEEADNTKRIVCGFLTSADGPIEVAHTLAAHCIVREHLEAPRRLIPLFEPHRLTLLHLTAPESWLNGWLGSISTLVYFDQSAQAQQLSLRQSIEWNECLPADTAHAQFHAPAIASLLLAWRRAGNSLPPNATQRALEQIIDAETIGLNSHEDQLVFGLSRLTVHPRLERHPAVQTAIENAIQGFESIPDAAWRGMTAQPAN